MEDGNEALNLNGSPKLPQTIILPSKISSTLGIPRRLTLIDRQQVVPTPVKRWMRADKRYGGWFANDSEPAETVIVKKVSSTKTKPIAPAMKLVEATNDRTGETVQVPTEGEGDGEDGAETPAANQPSGSEGDPAGNQEPKKGAENNTPPAESWAINMNVPDLREYAKRNGVVLDQDGKKDLKDDIITKLRAAKLPEAKVQETEPLPAGGKK